MMLMSVALSTVLRKFHKYTGTNLCSSVGAYLGSRGGLLSAIFHRTLHLATSLPKASNECWRSGAYAAYIDGNISSCRPGSRFGRRYCAKKRSSLLKMQISISSIKWSRNTTNSVNYSTIVGNRIYIRVSAVILPTSPSWCRRDYIKFRGNICSFFIERPTLLGRFAHCSLAE